MPLLSLTLRQLAKCALLILAVSFVTFALVSASPVDPMQANLGQSAYLSLTADEKAQLAAYWGTDQPFLTRYFAWLAAFVQGDMGTSLRFNAPVAQVIAEEGVRVVTTGAGNPEKYLELWKASGAKVIPVVASVALAKRMEKYGADAVVAEGCESGGHIGEQTTMTLVPQVADAVSIPVIAAGGIADGRGIAAAFMLGAEAVQIGTRFVVSKESIVHENYKQRIIKAKDIDSTVTGRSHGHPVRCLRNQMTREYIKLEQEGKSFEELEYLTLGTLRKAVQEGDVVNGTVMAGQIAGMIDKEQTCKEMIEEMMAQASQLMGWK